jgi:adenylate kinase
MAADTPNKGNGKGPILGPGNKPISESDRVKYNAVDKAQTKTLKASNSLAAKKQAAIKEAVAGKGAKKVAAVKAAPKKAAPKTVAKAPVKKVAPKKAK